MTQNKPTAIVPCPTCKKSTTWSADNPYRPFCCERCKLIDLGAWANEDYKLQTQDAPTSENGNPYDYDS